MDMKLLNFKKIYAKVFSFHENQDKTVEFQMVATGYFRYNQKM